MCDEGIDTGVDVPESDSMRRINILVASARAQGVLEDQEFFKTYHQWHAREFNISKYITSALEAFQHGEGIQLPTDVLHWPFKRVSQEPRHLVELLRDDEKEAKYRKFQEIVVNHLHLLLGSKPRIEKDEQGELMMFYE